MNKTIKIIFTLAITLILIATLSQACLASGLTSIINKVDSKANDSSADMTAFTNTAGKILGTIRNISAIVAVFVITILGIKYMVGSVEEKAGYKKSFIPLIVGIIVVVSATTIASLLFTVTETDNTPISGAGGTGTISSGGVSSPITEVQFTGM